MMARKEEIRVRNPFHDPLVTELIEDPVRYREMFSERILVGETMEVFQPTNVILTGPQGSGKSMILNLIRYAILSEWISKHGKPPAPLKHVAPFFGISVNLVRASFHAFGRRSVSRVFSGGRTDQALDAACAADFLNHYLFREFVRGIELLFGDSGARLRGWMGIGKKSPPLHELLEMMVSWDSWYGYYLGCDSLNTLVAKCERRLAAWRSFLNANTNDIPTDVWTSKSSLGEPLHAMGNLLRSLEPARGRLPLYVVIDQYEVLPELNPVYGTYLQRIVNTLIKARDPVVFYKIGARTYDWGRELRIWGAESRIEVQRDYVMISLSDVLMRDEDSKGWLFQHFARDVAYKRVKVEGHYKVGKEEIEGMFGRWSAPKEARLYFREKERRVVAIGSRSDLIRRRIEEVCTPELSPLELRLGGAWALQRLGKGISEGKVVQEISQCPWRKAWSWRKERIGIALLQIASLANQKRRYYGWKTLVYLSGANISAFLLLCGEIWDMATKMEIHPLKEVPLAAHVQTEGIFAASEKWRMRDRNEHIGGRQRYAVLSRLGPAIRDSLIGDLAISNPGNSGFSLRESDVWGGEQDEKDGQARVARFLENAVSWAILEERPHTSKFREGATRRKWYLHPLLSPVFGIPYIRAKEPLYTDIDTVRGWILGKDRVKFGRSLRPSGANKTQASKQLEMEFVE